MKIGIITSNELRHKFFRRLISLNKDLEIAFCICEEDVTSQKNTVMDSSNYSAIEKKHFIARQNSEEDFFKSFVDYTSDALNTILVKKNIINEDINLQSYIDKCEVEIIVSYGCSIIREPILTKYSGRFINIHLGLSPYYIGSGTNFWPLVNNEPEYIGVTYMHINNKIDGGNIIHQIRPTIYETDNVHSIGNRLIRDMTLFLPNILKINNNANVVEQAKNTNQKSYKIKDFNKKSVLQMLNNFNEGMITEYLSNKIKRDNQVPIIENKKIL